jgi:hypothetical protein
MTKSVTKTKRQYDKHTFARHFRPGQEVLVKIPVKPSMEEPGEKFYAHRRGPYKVLFRFDDNISYRLLNCDTNEQRTENVNSMKPYLTNTTLIKPTKLIPSQTVYIGAVFCGSSMMESHARNDLEASKSKLNAQCIGVGRMHQDGSIQHDACMRMYERTYAHARCAQTRRSCKSVTQFMRARFEIAFGEMRINSERLSLAFRATGYQRTNVFTFNQRLLTINLSTPIIIQRHLSTLFYQHRRLSYIFNVTSYQYGSVIVASTNTIRHGR